MKRTSKTCRGIVAAVAVCWATLSFAADSGSHNGLEEYAGDLRQLSSNRVVELSARFKQLTGAGLGEKWGWTTLQPWLLASFVSGDSTWVLAEAYPGYAIPDVSGLKLHFFNKTWVRVCSFSFPTGYRFFLNEVKVTHREELECSLVVARTTCAGPFITSPGPKRPAFEQGDFQLQYYALINTNLFMVRLEDNKGIVARNHYRWRTPPKGPPVPHRTKEEWLQTLQSTNVVNQLAALVWLTGSHLSPNAERQENCNQESVEDSRHFESVRDDVRTARILKELTTSKNRWVQEYAALGVMKEDN